MSPEILKQKLKAFCAFAGKNYVASNSTHAQYPEEIELAEALNAFVGLESSEQRNVRSAVNDSFDASEFATFAMRAASFAVQSSDAAKLRPGAMALLVDEDALDPRDAVRALGVLNEAATRLGVNLFRDVITPWLGAATKGRRKLIEDFFLHPDSIRNIKSLGLELANVNGAAWFRSCVM